MPTSVRERVIIEIVVPLREGMGSTSTGNFIPNLSQGIHSLREAWARFPVSAVITWQAHESFTGHPEPIVIPHSDDEALENALTSHIGDGYDSLTFTVVGHVLPLVEVTFPEVPLYDVSRFEREDPV